MIDYNELYEILRKEKYSETLQQLPKNFIEDLKEYLKENKKSDLESQNPLLNLTKSKKQLENSILIFKEIMLKRKRKILNLIFIANETGIMKKDYENMLSFEKKVFEISIKSFEDGDKELFKILSGQEEIKKNNKMILFNQEVEQFIDHDGNLNGPFKSSELVNLNSEIADILVGDGKAIFVDEH